MSYAFKLTTEVMRSVSFRSTNTKERTTEVFNNYKSVKLCSTCKTIKCLTNAILSPTKRVAVVGEVVTRYQ